MGGVKKVALYEAPFVIDSRDARDASDNSPSSNDDGWNRIGEAVAAGQRTEALKLFMRMVGVPGYFIAIMRLMPVWPKLKAIAHTLVYDGAIVRDYQRGAPLPAGQWGRVIGPALVMAGENSPVWMRYGNQALARVLPHARYLVIDGQTHMLKPEAHVPALVEFFRAYT
jgi:pimeloyl-ACP methyl ester carboxylesterase